PSGTYPKGSRVLLHFGAVDQICDVSIDGKNVGHHEGGYLPFTFDITDRVTAPSAAEGAHILQVHITDKLDLKYPYGKQSKKPGGMWYTPVSGIWQTVWIEEVPKKYIRGIKITPDLDGIRIKVFGDAESYSVEVYEPDTGHNPAKRITAPGDSTPHRMIYRETYNGNKTYIEIENPKRWTPECPYLYGIRVSTEDDAVASYFALREIKIKKVGEHKRFLLNGKPIFFHGVLDQGYYPEGIFLPNTEEGYDADVMNMKELGFNTIRKHIKVEPPAFYVACDVRGMLVWQDMINNSDYDFMRDTILPTFGIKAKTDHYTHHDPESRRIFEEHMAEEVKYLYNFPCIVYYSIFNEGWGQFDSDRLYEDLKEMDPTRIVDSTSGWFRQFKSDVVSRHVYFHKVAKIMHHHHPVVISEFGGYNYAEQGHTFNLLNNYGYKSFKDKRILSESIRKLYREDIISYIEMGCSGSIYTQLSDVEDETNGFYTYDRHICKVDKEIMQNIADELYSEFYRCVNPKE
ncbi:MAG: glycoside hydrolase family 2, partial [Lachnospiraceae bacterium]|nr:glycoside hydrolase family 2 [Lachnospiraceae bacterium]